MRPLIAQVTDGGGGYTGLDIVYNPVVEDFPIAGETSVSVNIKVDELDMGIDPDGYIVQYQLYALDGQTPEGGLSTEKVFYKSVNVISVNCSSNTIVYTTATGHPFVIGDYITIDGSALLRFNVVNKKITAVTANTFTIQRTTEGVTAGTLNTTAKARNLMIIGNLSSARKYDFYIQPFVTNPSLAANRGSKAIYADYITKTLNKATQNKTRPVDPNKRVPGKSYLQISNETVSPNQFQFAYKDFESVSVPVVTKLAMPVKKGTATITKDMFDYETSYYLFGTSMMISNSDTLKGRGGGGLGFFLSGSAGSGYYVILDSGALAADLRENELRVVKANGQELRVLADTQNKISRDKTGKPIEIKGQSTAGTLANTQGGKIYNISVKVKATPKSVQMIVDVNGFRVNVYDTADFALRIPRPVVPTKSVGVFCTRGKVMFDYVYARTITDKDFIKSEFEKDFYAGQFSNDFLETAYGDLTYRQNFNQSDIDFVDLNPKSIEEFGTTAREIRKFSAKFEGPSKPAGFSIGANRNVSVLSTKINNFEGEAFIVNNTSTTVPVEDGQTNSLFIWGNKISGGNAQEYSTINDTDFSYLEPITFESRWIQNEEDAKSLGNWIKKSVINKGKVIEMECFGNPLITVGDVVTIKYTYQGITGTEKFIVTKVNHSFNQGLVTSLTCRTL